MKKWMIWFLATTLLLSGCASEKKDSSGKLQKVSIMLDWYPNAVHSFLYTAQKKGYFKEQGLDVEIKMPANTNDPLKLVAANQVDMAISYEPQILLARGENIPVKSFGAIVRHPLDYLMVNKNSNVQSPKDLEGKTVGFSSIPLEEAMIDTIVSKDGGDAKKVKMIDVGFNLIPAVATNKTDGIIGGYINHEKLLLEKEGHHVRVFNPADYGVPDYYELVFAASDQSLKKNKRMYEKFMKAATKGQQYVQQHPKEGLKILLDHEDQSSPLDKRIEKKSLAILLPMMTDKTKPFGYQDQEIWEKTSKWLLQQGMLKQNVSPDDVFVNLIEKEEKK
ncbi:ABC transporter substrate-binding protein [Priestia koreensis]|uniref:ABC transporter substrate-binding protein n=1 Tax=Priestia koreensis TaxID=284581 RepID=UPI003458D7E9